jgi:hypothetical protein
MKVAYNLRIGGTVVLPVPATNVITIKAKVSNVTIPSISKADYKYNKDIAFMQGYDDALYNHYHHAFKVYNGGYSSLSNKTYEGLKYSDGTGKMINAHGTLVLPALSIQPAGSDNNAQLHWDWVNEMVAAGWSISNHSYAHGNTAPEFRYYDRLRDIKNAEQIFYDNAGYRTLVGTAPASESGFAFTFGNLGYFIHNSTANEFGALQTFYGSATFENTPDTYFNLDRNYQGDAFTNEQRDAMKAYIDEAWNDAKNGIKSFHNAFTHGPGDWQNFDEVSNYMLYNPTVPNSQDKIWLAGVQEFFEYKHTRQNTSISNSINGDDLTIVLNQKNIMDNVRDRSLSLLLDGLKIDSIVSVSGNQEVTFNIQTGLLNFYNIDTTRLKDPSTDVLPAQLISVVADGNYIRLTYDKPVTQSKTAGYTIENNFCSGCTGSGTNWSLAFALPPAGFLTYKSWMGNATTVGTDKKVCDYILYPIS